MNSGWIDCPNEFRAPFLPAMGGGWVDYPALELLFEYNGSGVQPARSWIIAPDISSLVERWTSLTNEGDPTRKAEIFHPHMRDGRPGDRHVHKIVPEPLAGHSARPMPVALDKGRVVPPQRYAFRSFDRHWIIPDNRLINQPNPGLWKAYGANQVYLTALHRAAPTSGPAISFASCIPDYDHYKGSFGGRVFPLWADASATTPNLSPAYLAALAAALGTPPTPEDAFVYLAAIAAHPAYTARFAPDLIQPGLRIPLTADPALFAEAAAIGRQILWLHTYGERFSAPTAGRPAGPPRLPPQDRPTIPAAGAIPDTEDGMPNTIAYTASLRRLHVGTGYIDNVPPEVWAYEVSGKQIIPQWFSYRAKDRSRPIIGDRRKPSPLGDIQPKTWLAEYTTDLLDLLNVLGLLVRLEPQQADLLARICAGELIPAQTLADAAPPNPPARRPRRRTGADLLDPLDPQN